MTRAAFSVALAVAVLLSCPIAAQKAAEPSSAPSSSPDSSNEKPSPYSMTMQGCIKNRHLTLSDTEAAKLGFKRFQATDFTLIGGADVLQRVREHDGHYDEIAGLVSVTPESKPVLVPSVDAKKLGASRVSGRETAPRVLTLKVESITHISDDCDKRR